MLWKILIIAKQDTDQIFGICGEGISYMTGDI